MSDDAPVCNLPNLSQVPALQAGRTFPAIPRASDLPSLIQAINALAQVVNQLTSPGLPPFRNNLAPFNAQTRFAGTSGIAGAAGADGSSGQAGKDGKEGKKIENPNWQEDSRRTERVKVMRPESENDPDSFIIMKRVTKLIFEATKKGKLTITPTVDAQDTLLRGGPILQGAIVGDASFGEGRRKVGTLKYDRKQGEEDTAFPTTGTGGEGTKDRPFRTGLMADCVGVQWAGGLAVEFLDGSS